MFGLFSGQKKKTTKLSIAGHYEFASPGILFENLLIHLPLVRYNKTDFYHDANVLRQHWEEWVKRGHVYWGCYECGTRFSEEEFGLHSMPAIVGYRIEFRMANNRGDYNMDIFDILNKGEKK